MERIIKPIWDSVEAKQKRKSKQKAKREEKKHNDLELKDKVFSQVIQTLCVNGWKLPICSSVRMACGIGDNHHGWWTFTVLGWLLAWWTPYQNDHRTPLLSDCFNYIRRNGFGLGVVRVPHYAKIQSCVNAVSPDLRQRGAVGLRSRSLSRHAMCCG